MTVKRQTQKSNIIRLGTRGSPLAMWQAHKVRDEIAKIDQNIDVQIVIITTTGDWKPEQGEVALQDASGGKGAFAKELEAALLANEIDIAVHSMKDMEADVPKGLCIPSMLEREDVRDVFLSNIAQKYQDLPIGSVVGTVSVRRASVLLSRRPDFKIVPLRGNVHTRIEKLNSGQVDATLLAYAGLKRLGLLDKAKSFIEVEEMLPAVGQGAIGIEARTTDTFVLDIIGQISHDMTRKTVEIERSVLRGLGGSCHTPVGVYVQDAEDAYHVRACLYSPNGQAQYSVDENVSKKSSFEEVEREAYEIGLRMKRNAPAGALS